MKLVLTMVQGPDRGRKREVDADSLVIGRGEDCDWAIADPTRVLSKNHLKIDFREGQYVLTDTSTNGVFLNGSATPIGRERQALLKQGDRIALGPVTLSVDLVMPSAAEDPFLAALIKPAPPAPLPIEDDPFAPLPGSEPSLLPPTAGSPGAAIPDDFDLDLPPLDADPFGVSRAESPFAARPPSPAMPPLRDDSGIPDDWLGDPTDPTFGGQGAGNGLIDGLWQFARAAAALNPGSAVAGNAVATAPSAAAAAALLSGPGGEQILRSLFAGLQELVLKHRGR